MRNIILKTSGIFLGLFGLVSLFMTTSVLLDLFNIRAVEGNYVLPVVYANFICAILYLFASYLFLKENRRAVIVMSIASFLLIIAFAALLFHIQDGGIYETKTVKAMVFRTLITLLLTGIAAYYFRKKKLVR